MRKIYFGRLIFSNPSVEEGHKIQLIRLKVDNTKNKLIPGMIVYVSPTKTTQLLLPDEKKSERKITYSLLDGDQVSVDKKDIPALTRTAAVIEKKLDKATAEREKKISEKKDKRITQVFQKKFGNLTAFSLALSISY